MQCQDKWNKYYQAVRAGWQSALEKAGEENRQLGANLETANTNKQLLETSLSSIQAERDRLQRELAEAASRPAAELKKTGEENRKLVADLETANKGMQLLKASLGRAEAERDRLQAALTKTAPRPGAEQLAAFPAGQASEGLVLLGIFVLTAGFFIGRRGHQAQWAKLAYGTVAAMISLGIYLGRLCNLTSGNLVWSRF